MARTLSLAATISLALMGLLFTTLGSAPEAFVRGSVAPSSIAKQDLLEARGERSGATKAQMPTSPLVALALRPGFGPAVRPAPTALRPPVRPYAASGPLALQVMDPDFGPEVRPDNLLVPDPPRTLAGASDLLCMAVAIYHEARDQPIEGQLAVASVILNRTLDPARWGATPCEVVVPVQFSFFSEDGRYPAIPKDDAWAVAVDMAQEILENGPIPLVGQADHYHTPAVDPDWNEDMVQVIRIEGHIFFLDPGTQG